MTTLTGQALLEDLEARQQAALDHGGYWKISADELRAAYALGRRDFRCADLRGANLRGADLRGANLRGANLYSANLYSADLYSADLRGANLYSADLTSARNFISAGPVGRFRRTIYAGFEDDGRVYVQAGCRHDAPDAVIAAIELDYKPGVMREAYIAAVRFLTAAAEAMRSEQSDAGESE